MLLCAPPVPSQVVEKANKKAKLADKELELYHLQDSDPLTAPELTAIVDRLFSGAQLAKADEAVLTGLAGQVGSSVALWVSLAASCQQCKHTASFGDVGPALCMLAVTWPRFCRRPACVLHSVAIGLHLSCLAKWSTSELSGSGLLPAGTCDA
jgi:hypothetical protein